MLELREFEYENLNRKGKKRKSPSDPVEYPYQKPSEAELRVAVQSPEYRAFCRFGYRPIVRSLEQIFHDDSLQFIVMEHVRYSKGIKSSGKFGKAYVISIYLMLLLLKDERDEYERVIGIINDIPRKGQWSFGNWLPTIDFIRNGEGLVSLTRALFGDKVEWPMVKPLTNVTPVSPLVCVDLIPIGTYVNIQFTIPKPRPTDSRCKYFMFLYRLESTSSEYDSFIASNATVIPKILSVSYEQLKKHIDSGIPRPDLTDPMLFEYFKGKENQSSAVSSTSTSTNVFADVTPEGASAFIEEPALSWEPNPKIDVKANNLSISTFHNFKVILNDHCWSLSVHRGSAVYLLHDFNFEFNGAINTLSVERMDLHKDLKPHVLQIVEAIVDPDEWAKQTGTTRWPVVSADSVKKAFFKKKTKDNDIESVGITLPLKCPLTMVRMRTPVRGSKCKHLTCFDSGAIPFLSKNARSFACPSCNKNLTEKGLVIDGYVQDILSKTESNVDDVTIDSKSGEWRINNCSSNVLESSEEDQMMPNIPRIDEPSVQYSFEYGTSELDSLEYESFDYLDSFEYGSSDYVTGSSNTDAILID